MSGRWNDEARLAASIFHVKNVFLANSKIKE